MTTQTIKLDAILADPLRFSVRSPRLDESHVRQMIEDLEAGRDLPPLRVAVAADPAAEWYRCPFYKSPAKRSQWRAEQRAAAAAELPDADWANWPIQPEAVLYDGFHVYAALVAAGRTEALVVVDEQPALGLVDVVARAGVANLRNGRRLTDRDVRVLFEIAWLGRPAKAQYERWTPEAGALDMSDISARFGKPASWCSEMKVACRIKYALGPELELPRAKCRLLNKLDEAEWTRFVYMTVDGEQALRTYRLLDDELRPISHAGSKTVVDMTVSELANVIEGRIRELGEPAPPVPPAPTAPEDPEDPPVENGQYLMEFDAPDWQGEVDTYTRVYDAARTLHPQVARDQALAMLPALRLAQRTYEALVAQAKQGGLEI